MIDGEDDKVKNAADNTHFVRTWVKAENGFSTKISNATWDFYIDKEYGWHAFGNGRKAYIVKMWRKDDFQNLLNHIDSNKDIFDSIRIREVKSNEL